MVKQGRPQPGGARRPSPGAGPRGEPPPAAFPLPSDTAAVARTRRGQCDNPGLWIDRFVDYNRRGNEWEVTQEAKRRTDVRWDAPAFRKGREEFVKRWREMLKACGVRDEWTFTAEPEWRAVVGLGAESVLETNLRLHRIYGFPIIPGSGLKGLTAACALWKIAAALGVPALDVKAQRAREEKHEHTPLQKLEALLYAPEESREEALRELQDDHPSLTLEQVNERDGKMFRQVFGTRNASGAVMFFDAIPLAAPQMKLDVMNPHYGEYYMDRSGRPPADYLRPVPVYFLTVERGSPFLFALGARNGDAAAVKRAKDWLEQAVRELGVGAKTTAGYGYFIGVRESAR